MKKNDLFDGSYQLKIMMYGNQELNHQVIGTLHCQNGQENERNRLENITKNRQNRLKFFLYYFEIYISDVFESFTSNCEYSIVARWGDEKVLLSLLVRLVHFDDLCVTTFLLVYRIWKIREEAMNESVVSRICIFIHSSRSNTNATKKYRPCSMSVILHDDLNEFNKDHNFVFG